ncbi:MAG: murein L,D-transpeptidase catalytic domain family protein [Sphingomicrobium sp.]
MLLSSAVSAAPGASFLNLVTPLNPIAPPQPFTPQMVTGVNPALLARAKSALDSHRWGIRHRDMIGVVDFSLGSDTPRFHVVDLMAGRAESFLVAHGRGSDPDHSGYVERFSNDFGSYASSNGTYATAETYDGKYGLSMKVKGLDWSNSNAESRAIVIHNAWYAESEMIAEHGKLGRSEGCFAFGRASQWQVMTRLGDGRMIYADKLA